MPQHDPDIYATMPLRNLLADEAAALGPDLQRCHGSHGLHISAAAHDLPPSLPMLGAWARMRLVDGLYRGDLRAAADEALPFGSDTFALVVLRHALEVAPSARDLLLEAARVLAPGGLLAITGMHPLSGWLPWWLWHGDRRRLAAILAALGVSRWLLEAQLSIERMQRVGGVLPGSRRTGSAVLGGGYLLLARKRRGADAAVPLRPRTLPAAVGGELVSGARRDPAV